MDGHFVPNITIGPASWRRCGRTSTDRLDVHLMIAPVDPYLEAFAEAGADMITIHAEAGPHLDRTLRRIRDSGLHARASRSIPPRRQTPSNTCSTASTSSW